MQIGVMAKEQGDWKHDSFQTSSGNLRLYQIQKEVKPEKHQLAKWKFIRSGSVTDKLFD